MPIYEYQCKECGHCFESLVFSGDAAMPHCPQCNGANVEKLMSAGCVRAQGIATGSGGFKPPPCRPSGG
ncbi:MAG: zinc ribbon domain-containing protein [Desulfobacterales bacterium]|nr:zinc ribbon domain-containing protein [Desulfobacterales bacterium]